MSSNLQNDELLQHLEFDDRTYFEAFRVPKASDGMTRVGKRGKEVHPHYLLNEWVSGRHAGIFRDSPHIKEASEIWTMAHPVRQAQVTKWRRAMLKEQVDNFYAVSKEYNECQRRLDRMFGERVVTILNSKRIIGCTTTAAAKYSEDIQLASPDVLLLEECGEILESHCITAMGENTQQLILIGDHKFVNITISFSCDAADG